MVVADDAGRHLLAVGRDLDARGLEDQIADGHDQAGRIDDHAVAGALASQSRRAARLGRHRDAQRHDRAQGLGRGRGHRRRLGGAPGRQQQRRQSKHQDENAHHGESASTSRVPRVEIDDAAVRADMQFRGRRRACEPDRATRDATRYMLLSMSSAAPDSDPPAESVPPGPPASNLPYLATLNPAQAAAVQALDGPLLVLAGAGTGKTRVLVTRLCHLIQMRRAWPSQILAVTFTNKAAREMRERVADLIGPMAQDLWIGTFHALAARILRRHAELVELRPNFTILDSDDQLRLLKQLMQADKLDDKRWPARVLLGVIERWKDRGLTPDKVSIDESGELAGGRLIALYRAYQERLRTLNACDFGDLMLHCVNLFTGHPEILESYQKRFRYLLVDEYQDTNVVAVSVAAPARPGASQHLLRRRRRPMSAGRHAGDDGGWHDPPDRADQRGRPRAIVPWQRGPQVFQVIDVFQKQVSCDLIRLRTASGNTLLSTPEHSHFADVILHESPQKYFTYLMLKRGYGYRLGTSQVYTKSQRHPVIGYQQRCLQEHGDAVWLVRSFNSENDARDFEHRLSLGYGVTTFPFVARKGRSTNGLVHDQDRLDRLHRDLGSTARVVELMEDHGLDPQFPHYVPQSAPGRRRNLILTLNAEHRGRMPMHRIALSGNDAEGASALAELGLRHRTYKRNSKNWRYETIFKDYAQLEALKVKLARRFDLTVLRKANLLGKALTIRPAMHLVPGMVVALGSGRHDVIVSVERVPFTGTVFDLNIQGTHNFVANGVITHNSIYGWRGAEVGNILRFETDFPGAQVVRLEQNYRSTGHILGAAAGLIANNRERLGKTLWTTSGEGEPVKVIGSWDGMEEARRIGDEIETLQRQNARLRDIAILVRAGFQTREFEERLMTLGVPYRVIGGLRFYERAEIRDALAYLRLVAQPDDDLAFERIVNTPRRGIGDATVQGLHRVARGGGSSLFVAAHRLIGTDELKPAARKALTSLVGEFDRWRSLVDQIPHGELAETVLDESGYTAMLQADKSPEAPGRLENLKELVTAMEEFENLGGFLEHVSLVMERNEDTSADQVVLMTLHSAKGLEFDSVFLPGWEEGLFPASARARRDRHARPRGGASAGLCRADARPAARLHLLRRQPAHPQSMAVGAAVALPRRAAAGSSRARGRHRTLWRLGRRHGGEPGLGAAAARRALGPDLDQPRPRHRPGRQLRPRPRAVGRPRDRRPRGRGQAAQIGQRLQDRDARVPPEIRLRHGAHGRVRPARDRLREGRHQEGDRQLRRSLPVTLADRF